MASQVEPSIISSGRGNSPKLPVIANGQSLVSQSPRQRKPSTKELAAQWALELRLSLEKKISEGDKVTEIEISMLKTELVALIISALQKDDRASWMFLREALLLLVQFKDLLSGKQELNHYLERLHHHLDLHKERLFDLHVLDTLKQVFPQEISQIQTSGATPAKVYCAPTPPRSLSGPARKPHPKFQLPDGRDPYVLEPPEDKYAYKPKPLTFGDLRKSMPDVVLEMAAREAIWKACPGMRALHVELPDFPEEDEDDLSSQPSSRGAEEDTARTPVVEDEMSRLSEEAEEQPVVPMSGREAVEYFSKCYHTGKIESMYFNVAPQRHFTPYDLVEVAKDKAKPEHYVFSTFGVLHVFPNQPSESMSLSDWQKEAVLYTAVSKIPFFKNYLLKKMFARWHSSVHYAEFAKTRHTLASRLLQNVPCFGASILEISRLCQEVLHLGFLPLETNKCYQLLEFENAVNYMSIQAEKMLETFFRYNKIITETTSKESFKKLKHCEEQVRHKTVFSKDSLHLQKLKKKQRQMNLRKAREETSRLGNFVKLVDQLLLAHLVQLAQHIVVTFVHKVMQQEDGETSQREGLFLTNLVFGPEDTLAMSPSKEKFLRVLSETLNNIPGLLCQAAIPLDGSVQLQDAQAAEAEANTARESPKMSSCHTSIISMLKDPKKRRLAQQSMNSASTTHRDAASPSGGALTPRRPSDLTHRDKEATGELTLKTPDLKGQATPTKLEDDLGQATPDLVLSDPQQDDLLIGGQGFMGCYSPLTKGHLEEKMANDEKYQEALKIQERLMTDAIKEVEEYCEKNAWLNEIYQFCKSWGEDSLQEWEGVAAFTIEQKLNEIRQWSEKVRNFDKNYVTDNGIFILDCTGVQDNLIPKLNSIFRGLCSFVADESSVLAKKFCEEMRESVANMKRKETSIGGFAVYARNVNQYKKNTPHYQQRMEYIKSLFEVIRMSYRQLSSEEERLEERVLEHWESFLSQIQDAMEFVNTQTPVITQSLEDTYQRKQRLIRDSSAMEASKDMTEFMKLETEARNLCARATTGQFLDPQQNPTTMLIEMTKLREKFYEIQKQMEQASKWKESITGEPYDLEFLQQMALQMDIRQELWKYVEVSTHAIHDWKAQLFKKFSAKKALDKVTEWQAAAGQMKSHLPAGDEVVAHWYRQLQDFKQDLPLLHKLSNDALKPRHWKTIFLGMGEQYDPEHEFVVDELLCYNLGAHSKLINTVYSAAVAEFAIEQRLVKVKKLWEEMQFKLAKFIPESVLKRDNSAARGRSADGKRMKKFEKIRFEKSLANVPRTLDLRSDQLFLLIDVDELKYLLQDSQVTLQVMLTSPYLADHKQEAEQWAESLTQIEEVIGLWHVCQKQWLFLLKVFEDGEVFKRMEHLGLKFEAIHLKFAEFIQAVVADPKVTSILGKQRGEKGYRVHQGDRLCSLLSQLIEEEEEILKHLEDVLDDARHQFPRLYFLSNAEVVELLGISRNPRLLLPFVRKCFSGIENLTFELPTDGTGMNTSLDLALKTHMLEATKLHGPLGEELPLCTRVQANTQATRWLSQLEYVMKTSMHTVMESCVQARLDDGSKQPIQLLEELAQYQQQQNGNASEQVEEVAREIKHTFSHWILRFPSQCVLVAEAVIWERSVFKALEKQDTEELRNQRSTLNARVDQYVKVIQETARSVDSKTQRRLHCLLASLVNQSLYHRDILDRLLQHPDISDAAFDWLRVLKYHMEIRSILRAKTESSDSQDEDSQSVKESGSERRLPKGKLHSSFEDVNLHHAMTTVSTGYQFGTCVLSQMGSTFAYDMEYLGNGSRLILTPLTERAHLSLTVAMKSFYCGSLVGPAGTGKSSTVRDLAKAMGRHIVTINCCEDLSLPQVNHYLTGVIQSGCWTLFDDTDRMTRNLMSVFAQQLDYLGNALRLLDSSGDNQYRIRGQPRFDKKVASQSAEKKIRRNSLTTLHSLPAGECAPPGLERQATVPHGCNARGLVTYFEDSYENEKERRHSIEREIEIKESELYKSMKPKPPPLFYEHVTLHRKPKRDFKELVPQYVPYKPVTIGNILFNGKLLKANANYGCFATINTANSASAEIPENLRLVLRPCALVIPDTLVVIETQLYCSGFQQYKNLSSKLNIFFDLLNTQMPRREQYEFGLRTMTSILRVATKHFHASQQHLEAEKNKKTPSPAPTQTQSDTDLGRPGSETPPSLLDLPSLTNHEEEAVISAITLVLMPKMATKEDGTKLKGLLRDVFPNSARPKSGAQQKYSPLLMSAVQEQLAQHNLQANPEFVNKVLQLYSVLQLGQGVVLIGPTGSGKTTIYQTLAKVLTILHSGDISPTCMEEDLMPGKKLASQYSQKLKILKESEARPEAIEHNKFWQRVGQMSSISSAFQDLLAEDREEEEVFPQVDYQVVFPNALSTEQLYGGSHKGQWQSGLLTNILRNAHKQAKAAGSFIDSFDERKNKLPISNPASIKKWVILDGSLNPAWVDSLNTLLDEDQKLSLASGEHIPIEEPTSVIFEVSDLSNASPAIISRCAMVHCGTETVPWKALVESWGQDAKQRWVINTASLQIINILISSTVPATLNFLKECSPALLHNTYPGASGSDDCVAPSLMQVSNFLRIMSAVLEKHFLREHFEKSMEASAPSEPPQDTGKAPSTSQSSRRSGRLSSLARIEDLIPNYMGVMKSIFAFSYIWGFGGSLHDSCQKKFDVFARETLRHAAQPIHLPESDSVFDYMVDCKLGTFTRWSDRSAERTRGLPPTYALIPEVDRYNIMIDLLLNSHHPVLLSGDPGVGKSALINHVVGVKHPFTKVGMCPTLTSSQLQTAVVNRVGDLEQKGSSDPLRGGAAQGHVKDKQLHHLFFIDDLNTARSDGVTGTQPTLELLRQLISQRSVFDSKRQMPVSTTGADFLAALTNPGAPGTGQGCHTHKLHPRLARLFVSLNLLGPTEQNLHSVFTKTVHAWLEEFPTYSVEHHYEFAKAIVQGAVDLYRIVKDRLRPTPTNAHYVFTLHDLAHVLEGVMLMSPRSKAKPKPKAKKKEDKQEPTGRGSPRSQLSREGSQHTSTQDEDSQEVQVLPPMMRVVARLWCHECTRVFGDRILLEEDQRWFESALEDVVNKNFCTGSEEWQEMMSTIQEDAVSLRGDTPGVRLATPPTPTSVASEEGNTEDKEEETTATMPEEATLQSVASVEATPRTDRTAETTTTTSSDSTTVAMETPFTEATTTMATSTSSSPVSKPIETDGEGGHDDDDGDADSDSAETETVTTAEPSVKPKSPGKVSKGKKLNKSVSVSRSHVDSSTDTKTTTETRSSSTSCSYTSSEYTSELDSPFASRASLLGKTSPQGVKPKTPTTQMSRQSTPNTPGVGTKRGGVQKPAVKRGVTFKAGLIADREIERYTGPLLSMNQIHEPWERLTSFLFSKYIVSTHVEAFGAQAEKGYLEFTEPQLTGALCSCLALYNRETGQKLDLVFFKEAVHHAARLSRVMATQRGHGLLLGVGYCTGRSTLVRLAAYFANCKLFEPKPQRDINQNRAVLHEHLKRCSRAAAFMGKQVALLVCEQLGDESLQDVCAFMREGMCPSLYTDEEIQNIAAQMTPGQVRITRVDKVEAAFGKFTERVKQNLHVFITLNYHDGANVLSKENSLQRKLSQFPSLLQQCCHVDVYRPWTHEAYLTVAESCLRDPSCQIPVPWNEHNRSEQISLISTAMAYIHMSAKAAIEKLYSHERVHYKFFTPLTFMEFVHIFKVIGACTSRDERIKYKKYESSLAKMNEAFDTIAEYKREVSDLVPRHQRALSVVKEHVATVEIQREQYIQALDKCKEEEEKIERMMSPLENLKQAANAEFDRVNPGYHAALEALKSLNLKSMEEIKSYRAPPAGVMLVMDAICLLFKEPQTWEAGKQLLMRDNFFQELEFYDKDNIPEDIYDELALFFHNPTFEPHVIMLTSQAATCLCRWVRAVYQYAQICRTMRPRIQDLLDAQQALNKAQATLGAKRVEANRIKSGLEKEIKAHKDAVAEAKSIEKQIQSIERRMAKANNLMENMSMQHSLWRSELKAAKGKLKTAPGDSLLTAACICYHGPLDNRTRGELMSDWRNRCELTNFDPAWRLGREVRHISLSAKLETFMKPAYSITDSIHSIQHTDTCPTEIISHKGDDVSSIHDTVHSRASSASSMPQMTIYRHHPSIYDTGITFRTEVRVLENIDNIPSTDLESIDASSASTKNLLAVRENYTLPDVLSTFEELSEWKTAGLPADTHSLHNALMMRACCEHRKHCWPLLVDPDNQAEIWVRALQDGDPAVGALMEAAAAESQSIQTESDIQGLQEGGSEVGQDTPPATSGPSYSSLELRAGTGCSTPRTSSSSRRTLNRMSGLSQPYSDDPRTLASVTSSVQEQLVSKIKPHIDRPDHNLWVLEADHPDLNLQLVNAIVHGVTILVTHLERKPLGPIFRGLLFKHFTVDSSGRQVVQLGDAELIYHPNFRLYLSTSVPIFLQGAGIHELPVQQMSVIDMAISQEGVIDTLLTEILRVERPEFETQKKSIESDLLHYRHELNKEQDIIMNKTTALQEQPLLDDKTMLEALQECQRKVEHNQTVLEETQYLQAHMREKRNHCIPIATQGAKLYEMVQRVSVLNPMYHMPFSVFLKIFMETVRGRHRGKGTIGAPRARTQELIDATTGAIYDVVSSMMFEQHSQLFALLLTLERLRTSQQLTNQELGLFVNGVDTTEIEDAIVFDDKPEWVTNKIWLDCAALETTMYAFRGLRESLSKLPTEWQEYFKCPTMLKNHLPGLKLQALSVFQKCLLWRICCPQKMWEVSEALVLHEMGGLMAPPDNYNIRQTYERSSKSSPIVMLLPSGLQGPAKYNSTKSYTFANPTYEILQFAKEVGMEGRVHVLTCGGSDLPQEVEQTLEDCMQAGHWLVLQNSHLSQQPWSDNVLQLLKVIVTSKPTVAKPSSHDIDDVSIDDFATDSFDALSTLTKATTLPSTSESERERVHENFRLWVTTRTDTGRLVPGLLIQHGLKVTCDLTHNFKNSLKRAYHNAEKYFNRRDSATMAVKKFFGQNNYLLPTSLLYALLIHRRNYGPGAFAANNFWSSVDHTVILDQVRIIVWLCQSYRGVADSCGQILAGHCMDVQDRKMVEALAEAVLLSPQELKKIPDHPSGVRELLKDLTPAAGERFMEKLDDIPEVSCASLGLPATAETELLKRKSKNLLKDLVRVCGAPELMSTPTEVYHRKAEIILQEMVSALQVFPELPQTSPDAFYPLELFFHSEVQLLEKLVLRLRTEVAFLLQVVQGEIPGSPLSQELLKTISKQQIPLSWQDGSFPSSSNSASSSNLTQWVVDLKTRAEKLQEYVEEEKKGGPIAYNLAVFQRPDRFVQTVLQTFVRREFKDLHKCTLDVQFLPMEAAPAAPPTSGAYLQGLLLHNASWDCSTSCISYADPLTGVTEEAAGRQMPILWLKPIDKASLDKQRSSVKYSLYKCPVFLSQGSEGLDWTNSVATLELPSKERQNLWLEKRVFLSCQLPKEMDSKQSKGCGNVYQ